MHTTITSPALNAGEKAQAQAVLARCVHCGFCNSACPTYLQLGEENNGPRGRIYQMKTFLEGGGANSATLKNLDQCLTCQACESACPSGVQYTHLLEIARPKVAAAVGRSLVRQFVREMALRVFLRPQLLRFALTMAQPLRAFLPRKFRPYFQLTRSRAVPPPAQERKKIVLFDGCVQSAINPRLNAHTAAVCARCGIASVEEKNFCCGALELHMEAKDAAMTRIRANVDKLHQQLEDGATQIVSTASGCGRMVADYGRLLADDPRYAEKAKAVSDAHMDIAALLLQEDALDGLQIAKGEMAFHCPCTLHHAQGQGDAVQTLFARLGAAPPHIPADSGRCCGSAGFYSQEHPALAKKLRDERLAQLSSGGGGKPARILTANIGCQLHLQGGSDTPVTHWIEQVKIN